MAGKYVVAFAGTKEAGVYEGIVTWTHFESKEAFDKWYTEDIRKRERVVEEGITPERAIELGRQTPLACRIAVALEKAKDEETGEINDFILETHLQNALSVWRRRLPK